MPEVLAVSAEVARARTGGLPVVALETTLVTHGFPRAEGLEVATALAEEIRREGATPAFIGVLEGRLRVGLTPAELERLASAPDVVKVNPANLAARIAGGAPGSTTVAATILAAHRAGIEVFATGGLGGVHRDVGETGDISADLVALARVPVAVVCAGAKAVLDLPRTREALETLGVPVYGVGTDELPAFYRRRSGLPVDHRFDAIDDLAAAVRIHVAVGTGSGVVVANPIPVEDEMPRDLYDKAMSRALAETASAGIRGRDVTPFLLDRLRELTEGRSVFTNRALLMSNAKVAARLAAALARR